MEDKDLLQLAIEYTDSMMYGDKTNAKIGLGKMGGFFNVPAEQGWEYLRAELRGRGLDEEYDIQIMEDYGFKLGMAGRDREIEDIELARKFELDDYLFYPSNYGPNDSN